MLYAFLLLKNLNDIVYDISFNISVKKELLKAMSRGELKFTLLKQPLKEGRDDTCFSIYSIELVMS